MPRHSRQCSVKQDTFVECVRKLPWFYQLAVPRNMGIIAGFRWTKSQRPRSSKVLGAMVKNGWCIIENFSSVIWRKRRRHPLVVNNCEYRDYICLFFTHFHLQGPTRLFEHEATRQVALTPL